MMKDPQKPEQPEDTQQIPAVSEDQLPPVSNTAPADAPISPREEPPGETWSGREPVREPVRETPEQTWARSLEDYPAAASISRDVVLEREDQEGTGLTVGDGFRFGCGFALATAIGALALLIVATLFFAVGTLIGFKPPF